MTTRNVGLVFRKLISLVVVATLCSTVFATDPFPPARIYQHAGAWHVDYLSGSRIDVYSEDQPSREYSLRLEDALPRVEFENFVFQTSAGPDWAL